MAGWVGRCVARVYTIKRSGCFNFCSLAFILSFSTFLSILFGWKVLHKWHLIGLNSGSVWNNRVLVWTENSLIWHWLTFKDGKLVVCHMTVHFLFPPFLTLCVCVGVVVGGGYLMYLVLVFNLTLFQAGFQWIQVFVTSVPAFAKENKIFITNKMQTYDYPCTNSFFLSLFLVLPLS